MAWVTWVKDTLWNNNQIGKIGQGTLKFTFNTVANLFDQIGKLPRVAYSLTYHQPSRQITNSLNYIVIHDLLPMILVNSVNTLLQDAYGSQNEEEQDYFSSAYFLSSALATLHYAVNLYTVRQGLQMTTRTMLVALSAPDAFNQIHPRPKSPLCIEDKCTTSQRIKANGRELIELMANDLAVSAINKLPMMSYVSFLVSMYVRGRYIAKSTTPERCPDHRGIESEYALALGIGHEGMMILLRKLLSSTIGLPAELCLNTMEKMLLVFQMAVAAHLNPPLIRNNEGTLKFDPLEKYEQMIGWFSKVIASGLIKQVPPLFDGNGMMIPWGKILTAAHQLNNHPRMNQFKGLILPHLLQSDQAFVNDPVIRKFWTPLQKQLDTSLTFILNVGKNDPVVITLATFAPRTTALALKMTFGIPQRLTKALILVAGDKKAHDVLTSIQHWIQSLNTDIEVNLKTQVKRPALRLKGSDKKFKSEHMDLQEESAAASQRSQASEEDIDIDRLLFSKNKDNHQFNHASFFEGTSSPLRKRTSSEPTTQALLGV